MQLCDKQLLIRPGTDLTDRDFKENNIRSIVTPVANRANIVENKVFDQAKRQFKVHTNE